jgi:hypothetical protein
MPQTVMNPFSQDSTRLTTERRMHHGCQSEEYIQVSEKAGNGYVQVVLTNNEGITVNNTAIWKQEPRSI